MSLELLSREELSIEEMAARLEVDTAEVLRREQAGELFSYRKSRRGEHPLFPAYQLAPEIYPDLLLHAGAVLQGSATSLETFFNWRDRDMAFLTVREVLAGQPMEGFQPDDDAWWLLAQPVSLRTQAVLAALERVRAVDQDWR
jgi:hypothetical protein